MRNTFNTQLDTLNAELVRMGTLCERAIAMSVGILTNRDSSDIENVLETDTEIDRLERDIEGLCMKLILHQQPVASDLRKISSALKMISDMERIGDQASDIAEIARYIIGSSADNANNIKEMAKDAVKMVSECVDAFVKNDLAAARRVIEYDDVVDNWFVKIKNELTELISKNNSAGEYYIDLLMIAKYLERIGDHATNISEWVEYSITGKHPKA